MMAKRGMTINALKRCVMAMFKDADRSYMAAKSEDNAPKMATYNGARIAFKAVLELLGESVALSE